MIGRKKAEYLLMSPWVRTAVWCVVVALLLIIAYYDGMNAMDAISRQCAHCKGTYNITQMLHEYNSG